jgi:hypothetical protein
VKLNKNDKIWLDNKTCLWIKKDVDLNSPVKEGSIDYTPTRYDRNDINFHFNRFNENSVTTKNFILIPAENLIPAEK